MSMISTTIGTGHLNSCRLCDFKGIAFIEVRDQLNYTICTQSRRVCLPRVLDGLLPRRDKIKLASQTTMLEQLYKFDLNGNTHHDFGYVEECEGVTTVASQGRQKAVVPYSEVLVRYANDPRP
jgi:hypothetical protein